MEGYFKMERRGLESVGVFGRKMKGIDVQKKL